MFLSLFIPLLTLCSPYVQAAECASFTAAIQLDGDSTTSFDLSPSLASFADKRYTHREESPPTITTNSYLWGNCAKGGLARDGTVEAGEQCPEHTLLCRISSNVRPAHRLEPARITSVIPILSLSRPFTSSSTSILMPYAGEGRTAGDWEPKGWRAIRVTLIGEKYAGVEQRVTLVYQCVEGEDSKLAFVGQIGSTHVFTIRGKEGCVDWARAKPQGGGETSKPIDQGPSSDKEGPSQDAKRPSMPQRARGVFWWLSGFGFILVASILLLLLHRRRIAGQHNIFRRRASYTPLTPSSPRQSKFPRVSYVNVMFDADQEEAAGERGRRGEERTPLLG